MKNTVSTHISPKLPKICRFRENLGAEIRAGLHAGNLDIPKFSRHGRLRHLAGIFAKKSYFLTYCFNSYFTENAGNMAFSVEFYGEKVSNHSLKSSGAKHDPEGTAGTAVYP